MDASSPNSRDRAPPPLSELPKRYAAKRAGGLAWSRPVVPGAGGFIADFAGYAGGRGALAAFLVGLGALLEGLSLVLIVPLLGIIFGAALPSGRLANLVTAVFERLGVTTPFVALALVLGVFAVVVVVRAVILSRRDIAVATLQSGFVAMHRLRIASYLAEAPWGQVVRLRHARVTHVMSGDMQRVAMMTNGALQSAVAAVTLGAQAALIFALAPLLAGVALLLVGATAFAFVPVMRRAHRIGGFLTDANLALLSGTAQFLGGLKLALSQNLQARYVAEFRETLDELTARQLESMRQQSLGRIVLAAASALAALVLVLVGFGLLRLSPAVLIGFIVIISRMLGPVMLLQQNLTQFAQNLPAYAKLKELETELGRHRAVPSTAATAVRLAEGRVAFDDVAYRHDAGDAETGFEPPAGRGVEGVSLVIEPGAFVGVAGNSGAGKTTFADLLAGLIAPQRGRITVDGVALEADALIAWRDRLSYVSQDPFLFHDTIRRNLCWANPQAGEPEIWSALALVGADALVRGMEAGLDTVVGERGALVSGGERQRIALARALLRQPRLLLLDEATSALDSDSERLILARLGGLPARAESLSLCERVLRFDNGRLVQC